MQNYGVPVQIGVVVQFTISARAIKETSTVRISAKGKKPIPKIVFRYGLQDKQIEKYLETRKLILDFLRKEKR